MFNKEIVLLSNHVWGDRIIKIAICTVLVFLVAPYTLEWAGSLPLTMQTLMVLLPALIFGTWVGGITVALYLIGIALGLPILSGYQSNPEAFGGFTGGFIQSFLLAAFLIGFLAENWNGKLWLKQGVLLLLGHAIILALGLFWWWNLAPEDEPLDLLGKLAQAAMIKIAFGWFFLNLIARLLKNREKRKAIS